ncbi:DUF2012 domain containing protein [Asbolus verrucosus]|uniref:DUF2012 domain containing protein n=1 Tax=Asbolus verrucosus TaxID=1661398 RepID=A0A482W4R2_ASBVE|nr:DUF2012 domain containing protein [Asbolus verrucosus]
MSLKLWYFLILFLIDIYVAFSQTSLEEENETERYAIEGKIFLLSDYQTRQANWPASTRIHVNGGQLVGFVKKDGSFIVHNVPSGSYIVEVLNPEYTFEPVRVEINSRGKYRARKVNHIQTSLIIQVPYPLSMKALAKTRYFQVREQWRITDFIFNPMVLMMVLPLLLVMLLPKMMNDPETKKEMEQIQSLTKFELPEMSDMVSNFLAGSSQSANAQQNKKNQKTKKRQ